MYSLRSNDKTSFLDKGNNIINNFNRIMVQNSGEQRGNLELKQFIKGVHLNND